MSQKEDSDESRKFQSRKVKEPPTTLSQQRSIMAFMATKAHYDETNWAHITNIASKVHTGMTHNDIWEELSQHLKGECGVDWMVANLRSRWQTMLANYKKAKGFSNVTGYGITENDRKVGIDTMDKKIFAVCPMFQEFSRLDTGTDYIGNTLYEVGSSRVVKVTGAGTLQDNVQPVPSSSSDVHAAAAAPVSPASNLVEFATPQSNNSSLTASYQDRSGMFHQLPLINLIV